jgi:hypothetical protein
MGVSPREERRILQSLGRTPVPRSYVREKYRHALVAPERQQAIQETMRRYLPEYERVLIGQWNILAFLQGLHLMPPNGGLITWRMVRRWTQARAFALLHGAWRPRHRTPPMTTTYAVTAWVLSRQDTDQRDLFMVR